MFDAHAFANVIIVFTIATIVVAAFKNIQCALALAFSLLSARYLTHIGATDWHAHAMFFSAFICVVGFKEGKFRFLEIEDSEINYAVSFIYMIRMVIVALLMAGLIGSEVSWIGSISLLCVQNLLVIGGCVDGYASRINVGITNFRFRVDEMVFSR